MNQESRIKPKKFLGQNFLKNKKILELMADAAELTKEDVVLEIGPGTGTLTKVLANKAKKVIAVEKDPELVAQILKRKIWNNVEIIHGDILKKDTLEKIRASCPMLHDTSFKIVANIPYYITSRFLRLFLSQIKFKPTMMVLMVQYEVAKRITTKPPHMNLLALSVQAFGKVEFIKKIPKKFFSPQPEVDSAIIKISEISDRWFLENKIDPEKIFEIARRAFQQKRKMLRHSLKNFHIPEKFQKLRPEELLINDWITILDIPTKGSYNIQN